jgi:hypothetical protein
VGSLVAGIDVLHVGQRSAAIVVVAGSLAALALVLAGETLLTPDRCAPLGRRAARSCGDSTKACTTCSGGPRSSSGSPSSPRESGVRS